MCGPTHPSTCLGAQATKFNQEHVTFHSTENLHCFSVSTNPLYQSPTPSWALEQHKYLRNLVGTPE